MTYDVGYIYCSEKDCEAKIKNHYWGKVKSEWLFLRDDKTQFCPDHLPEWATKRRKKRG